MGGFAALMIAAVTGGGAAPDLAWSIPWIPALDIALAFRLDGLSLLFGLLITGIAIVVLTYAAAYTRDPAKRIRLIGLLTAFMVAMLGLAMSDDLIVLFIFWEMTTIVSFLLIGFDHTNPTARRNALQGLLVTGLGGLVMLAGFIVLGNAVGTYRLSEVIAAVPGLPTEVQTAALLLVLAGAFTKSAQVPFHFWLPNAMSAPTPVSAYLHSATMVKAGIFLLARLHPAFSGHELWFPLLTAFGATTAVWASVQALRQSDMKLVLAHTTVMALGTLTMLLASSEPVAIAAALTFLIVHALYKSTLFLMVGAVDHSCGTRDWTALGGMARSMPLVAVTAFLGAAAMSGFPPFLGFIGKELKYEGALALTNEPSLVAAAIVLANAMMVAAAGIVALKPFLGRPSGPLAQPTRPAPRMMVWGPLTLALLGLLLGLMPDRLAGSLVQDATVAILDRPYEMYLALWHGINLPLMLSVVTVALGVAIYLALPHLRLIAERIARALPWRADSAYDRSMAGILALATGLTRVVQPSRLTLHVGAVLAVFALVLVVGLWAAPPELPALGIGDVTAWEAAAIVLVAGGAVGACVTRSRLAALTALGATGTGLTLIFLTQSAVDVAVTQFMVETLIVLLVAAVIPRLPRLAPDRARRTPGYWLRIALAGGIGLMVFLLMLGLAPPVDRTIPAYYEAQSVPGGHGRNIVNVILVDFRALDTLGEIIVVVVAALGAYALLRGSRRVGKDAR
ncbi:MAG: proton-conducting transporter membrane subunit [Azospirillaceae bacterium]